MNLETLKSLRERVLAASGPDDALDGALCVALQYGGGGSEGATGVRLDPDDDGWLLFEVGEEECCNRAPEVTASIDTALGLVERVLPGWWISAGLCAVSGDCSMAPDHNDPAHRERLLREFPPTIRRYDEGFHNDLRPGDGRHRVCQAILVTLLDALIFIEARKAAA